MSYQQMRNQIKYQDITNYTSGSGFLGRLFIEIMPHPDITVIEQKELIVVRLDFFAFTSTSVDIWKSIPIPFVSRQSDSYTAFF